MSSSVKCRYHWFWRYEIKAKISRMKIFSCQTVSEEKICRVKNRRIERAGRQSRGVGNELDICLGNGQLRKPWISLAGANEKEISWSRRHAHFNHDF